MHPSCFVLAILVCAPMFAIPVSFERRAADCFLTKFGNGSVEIRRDRIALGGVVLRFVNGASGRVDGVGRARAVTYLRTGGTERRELFAKVTARGIYRGVDAIFYGAGDKLEYDLELDRASRVSAIRLGIEGAEGVRIDKAGDLEIRTDGGGIKQKRPHVFQGGREHRGVVSTSRKPDGRDSSRAGSVIALFVSGLARRIRPARMDS